MGDENQLDDLSAVTVPQDRIAAVLRLVESEAITRLHELAQKCDPATARAADAMGLSKVAAYLHDRAALPADSGGTSSRQPFASGSPGSGDGEGDGYEDDDFEEGEGEGKEGVRDEMSTPVLSRQGRKENDRRLAAHMLGLEVAADGYVDSRQLSDTPSRDESIRVRSDIARF